MDPLLSRLPREQQLAILRQQAPKPPDISTFKDLVCSCGNAELEVFEFMKFNPLEPQQYLRETKRRCKSCKAEPVLEGGSWVFKQPDPQPEPKPEEAVHGGLIQP
jgi:hypothetical protein